MEIDEYEHRHLLAMVERLSRDGARESEIAATLAAVTAPGTFRRRRRVLRGRRAWSILALPW